MMIKREIQHFCLSTALHGYRFIFLPRRILLERCFWIIICLIALFTASTLLALAYINVQEMPTVTVTDSNHYPIWHYDFPAVTICNYNKISSIQASLFAKELAEKQHINQGEVTDYITLFYYLYEHNTYSQLPWINLEKFQYILDVNNIFIPKQLSNLSPSCDNLLVRCLWKGEVQRCSRIFETVLSSNGFCCSFNYYGLINGSFTGFRNSEQKPRRVSACGYETGLQLLINNQPEDYFVSNVPSYGVKVLIHSPFTVPDWNLQNSLIEMKTVNFLGLTPTLTYCTEDVQNISAEKRNCWYSHERKLVYHKIYNFKNCMVECRMNLTIELCQCVPFFFVPNEKNHAPARFCNLKDIKCLTLAAVVHNLDIDVVELVKSSVPGYKDFKSDNSFNTQRGNCNCLPDCQITTYTIEGSSGVLSRDFCMNHQNLYSGIKLTNHSVIRVYFNDLVGIKNRTDVRFNWHALLAYYGGLLGLFMGFSLISGTEIIYLLTIRPLTRKRKDNSPKSKNDLSITGKIGDSFNIYY